VIGELHDNLVFGRRIRVLADAIGSRLPDRGRVLDVGCGSGDLAALILQRHPDLRIEGIDVLVRPQTAIPVTAYDGVRIPFENDSFDAVMMTDVLHHTDDPRAVLGEAARVAATVVVKDHLRDGFAARPILRFMDWVGNASHGVRLPYNYLSRSEWERVWSSLGLKSEAMATRLSLYPRPFTWLFDRELHFVAILRR
jgi:SAM-dependent methyltransferase